jgi:hypothetical protein
VWLAAITDPVGLRAIHHAGNKTLANVLFAEPGGSNSISLVTRPAVRSSSDSMIFKWCAAGAWPLFSNTNRDQLVRL